MCRDEENFERVNERYKDQKTEQQKSGCGEAEFVLAADGWDRIDCARAVCNHQLRALY